MALLIFGLLVIGIEVWLANKSHWDGELTFRMIGLTLVLILGVVLLPVGYSDIQIAPVFGLLGVVAGYLLTSNQARSPK